MIERFCSWIRSDRGHAGFRRPHGSMGTGHRRLGLEQVEDRLLLAAAYPVDMESVLGIQQPDSDGFFRILVSLNMACGSGSDDAFVVYAASRDRNFADADEGYLSGGNVIQLDFASHYETLGSDSNRYDSQDAALIAIVPDELPARRADGGMIDLTWILNKPGREADAPSLLLPEGETEVANAAADQPGDVPTSRVPMDGSRGRSQAFELAMTLDIEADLGPLPASPGLTLATSQPVAEPLRPTDTSDGATSGEQRTPADTMAFLPQVSEKRLVRSAARAPALVFGEASGRTASDTPAGHGALFAELVEPSDEPSFLPIYLDKNRHSEAIPILAVAVVSQHLAKRRKHTPSESPTCQLPPRRVRKTPPVGRSSS